MAELKITNNPCKYCNGEIDEGKPLCGDIVNDGDIVNIVKTKEGYEIELWRNVQEPENPRRHGQARMGCGAGQDVFRD